MSPIITITKAERISVGLGDLLNGLSSAAKQNKDGSCPSVCQMAKIKGGVPSPKYPKLRPYSNGCSVPASMRGSLGDYSVFEGCCDLHDACYTACGIPKQYCEQQFQRCMKQSCKDKFSQHHKHNSIASQQEQYQCTSMAHMFATGTAVFGCGGYQELQDYGCECLAPEQARERMMQYAQHLWAAFNTTHPELPWALEETLLEEEFATTEKQAQTQGVIMYKLMQKYPAVIDKISSDGESYRQTPSFFGNDAPVPTNKQKQNKKKQKQQTHKTEEEELDELIHKLLEEDAAKEQEKEDQRLHNPVESKSKRNNDNDRSMKQQQQQQQRRKKFGEKDAWQEKIENTFKNEKNMKMKKPTKKPIQQQQQQQQQPMQEKQDDLFDDMLEDANAEQQRLEQLRVNRKKSQAKVHIRNARQRYGNRRAMMTTRTTSSSSSSSSTSSRTSSSSATRQARRK